MNISKQVRASTMLHAQQKMILDTIIGAFEKGNYSTLIEAEIAHINGVCHSTVTKTIRDLKSLGVLERIPNGKGTKTFVRFDVLETMV